MNEMSRLYSIFGKSAFLAYIMPLYEQYGDQYVDKYNQYSNFYWDDASRAAAYIDYVTRKITKYGLQYGMISQKKFYNYKQTIQDDEDRLVDYFLYEMRKAPSEKKQAQMKI